MWQPDTHLHAAGSGLGWLRIARIDFASCAAGCGSAERMPLDEGLRTFFATCEEWAAKLSRLIVSCSIFFWGEWN